MTLLPQTVARTEELQAAGMTQRAAARRLLAEGHRISRGSVGAIFNGRRPSSTVAEDEGPREVPAYRCEGCRNKVWLKPCQICRTREYILSEKLTTGQRRRPGVEPFERHP